MPFGLLPVSMSHLLENTRKTNEKDEENWRNETTINTIKEIQDSLARNEIEKAWAYGSKELILYS